jgi:3-oxoacyl-(acyl-carrier-protein) synthase/acyl carrier protein
VKLVIKQVLGGLSNPVQAVVPRGALEFASVLPSLASLVEHVWIATAGARAEHGKVTPVGKVSDTIVGSRWHGVGYDEARRQILAEVTEAVENLLGEEVPQEGVDISAPLMDMGLDSLAGTQLMRQMNDSLGVDLSPTLLFDYPTMNALSDHLAGLVSDKMVSQDVASKVPEQVASRSVDSSDRSVAIIGMSCRFPGGIEGTAMFWDVIQAGRCVVSKVPFSRWDVDAAMARDATLNEEVKRRMLWGGFVEDLELFDASFFKISAAEARAMDPQQRLLLEYSYLAFHDAKYTKEALEGHNAGVFVGIAGVDALEVAGKKSAVELGVYSANGTSHSTAAGRVSFVFGLQGPCAAYDTACSSALVALHAAVRCLQHDDCDLAVVLGVNAMLTATISMSFAGAGMTTPTGRCHTFDEGADGYCRGEGCGAVVLKRMGDALSDQDRIHAVVRGIGVAQDGTSASLIAPNGRAQEKLLRAALRDAGLKSQDVDYLEAHGTGTALGDPIEMSALKAAMSEGRSDEHPLIMGGVKANIGHLEAAAGMTGSLSCTSTCMCRLCSCLSVVHVLRLH